MSKSPRPASSRTAAAALRQRVAELEAALAQSQAEARQAGAARLQAVFEASPLGLILTDLAGLILSANPAAGRLLGTAPAELAGQSVERFSNPDDFGRERALIRRLLAGELAHAQFEKRLRPSAGQEFWVRLSLTVVRDAAGQPNALASLLEDVTARQAAEAELRHEHGLLTEVLAGLDDSIAIVDTRTRQIRLWNAAAERIFGYSAAEAQALPDTRAMYIDEADFLQFGRQVQAACQQQGYAAGEVRMRRRSGAVFPAEYFVRPLAPAGGAPHLVVSVVRDLTEQRAAQAALEENRRQMAAVFAQSMDAIVVFDDASCIHDVNPAGCALVGLTRADLLGQPITALLVDFDWAAALAVLKRDGTLRGEARLRRFDGAVRTMDFASTAEVLPGRHISVLHDLTERKAMEAALQARTAELDALHQASQQLNESLDLADIYRALPELIRGRMPCDVVYVSQYSAADNLIRLAFGWHWGTLMDTSAFPPIPLEAEGRGTQSIVIRSGRSWRLDDFQAQLGTAQTVHMIDEQGVASNEAAAADPNIPRSALIVPLILAGQVTGVLQVQSFQLAAFTDADLRFVEALAARAAAALHNAQLFTQAQAELAARQQVAAELRAKDAELRLTLEAASVGTWSLDLRTLEGYWSENLGAIFGFQTQDPETNFARLQAALHPEDAAAFNAAIQAAVTAAGALDIEFRVKVGAAYRWVAGKGQVLTDAAGRPEILRGVAIDIQARKLAEERERQSQARFRAIVENGWEVVVLIQADGQPLYISPAIADLLGYPAAELLGRPISRLVHPDDLQHVQTRMAPLIGTPRASLSAELQVRHQDGRWRWIEARISNHLGDPAIGALVATAKDVTERKSAELALRESQERLALALSASRLGLYDLNARTGEVLISPEYARMLGYEPAEFAESGWMEGIHPEDHPRVSAFMRDFLAGRQDEYQIEFRQQARSGTWHWILALGRIVERDAAGAPVRVVGTHLDITERRQAEAQLRDAAERLQLALQAAHAGAWEWDSLNGQVFWSAENYRVLGREPVGPSVTPAKWLAAVHPADRFRALGAFGLALLRGEELETEFRVVWPTGQERWLRAVGRLVRDAAGQPVRMLGLQLDITEQKRAEAGLRESEGRFRQLAENIQEVFWMLDAAEQRLLYLSPAFEKVWGQSREAAYADRENFLTSIHSDDRAAVLAAMTQQMDGAATECEYRVVQPDGTLRWVWDRGFPIYAAGGRVVRVAGIAADITERKQAEAEIRLLNENLEQRVAARTAELAAVTQLQRAVLNSATAAFVSVDTGGLVTSFNASAERLFGWPAAAVIGRLAAADLHDPGEVAGEVLALARLTGRPVTPLEALTYNARQGQPNEREWIMCRRDGGRFPAMVSVTAIRDADHRITGFLGIYTDLTSRKQMEAELNTQRELARQVMETMGQGVVVFDRDGRAEYINPHLARLLGRTPADLVGATAYEFVASEDRATLAAGYSRRAQGESDSYEVRMIDGAGVRRPMLLTSTPLWRAGEPAGGIAILTDLTRLKDAEARLAFQAKALDAVGQAIIATDQRNQIVYWNQAAERLYGWPQAEVLGLDVEAVTQPDYAAGQRTQLAAALRQGRTWTGELWAQHRSRRRFPTLAAVTQLTDEAGRLAGLIITAADITSLHQAEAELRQSRDRLSAVNRDLAKANRLKDEFLANMSHELRTPLTGILGLSETLQNGVYGPLTSRQLHALHMIEESGRHLLNLINDILDLSKVEAGQMTLHLEIFSVADICQAGLRLVRQLSQTKRQRVEFRLTPLDLAIYADARRLKQILVNLLSNAVKFTPEDGAVKLEVALDAAAGQVRFIIQDSGIGIAPENLPRLFQPFVQLDSGLARQYTGSGLGLALVKHLVDLHGGGISVESTPGQGSRFTVVLPWQETDRLPPPAATAELPAAQAEMGAGRLILLAEDNETNIRLFSDYLHVAGFRVAPARDGEEAVALAQAQAPAAILMDIQMPGLDGLEAIRRIRHLPSPAAHVPILALTALAMPGDEERCLAAGANGYLSKPVHLAALLAKLAGLLAAAPGPAGSDA